jgi:hypothetical protein
LSIENARRSDCRDAHAVADHQDDISGALRPVDDLHALGKGRAALLPIGIAARALQRRCSKGGRRQQGCGRQGRQEGCAHDDGS